MFSVILFSLHSCIVWGGGAGGEKWPQSLPARTFRRRENSALNLEHPPSSTAAGLSLEKGSRRSGCWEYLSGQRFFRVSMEEVIP